MKIRELLIENNIETPELIKKIKDACGQFISESRGLPLYRGMARPGKDFILTKDNQYPRDSTHVLTNLLNLYVEEKFGIKAIRTKNRFYATGDIRNTVEYSKEASGLPYWIFPVDGYKFVWSSFVDDASTYIGYNQTIKKAITLFQKLNKNNPIFDIPGFEESIFEFLKHKLPLELDDLKSSNAEMYVELQPYIEKILDDQHYSDKDLRAAILSGNEITFQGIGYFAIEAKEFTRYYNEFYEKLK